MRTACVLLLTALAAQAQGTLLPIPFSVRPAQGNLPINPSLRIALPDVRDPRLEDAAARLTTRIRKLASGSGPESAAVTLRIQVNTPGLPVQALEENESYRLEITSDGAMLSAPNPLGALHGLETFYQLITVSPAGLSVPALIIEDHPRFPWRGLMIDVSRHFIPLDVLRRNLDAMAAVKLNVFHWHLTDDQGFRVESKLFPRLHEAGSDGLYYSQEDIRAFVQYARNRGIRVVPEFDLPGHAASWLTGYPELGSGSGPFHLFRTWGGHDAVFDPAKPAIYQFLDAFLGEMASIFPDAFVHIGGDEVAVLRDGQTEFNRQLRQILLKHGKRMEGWDEILDRNLPTDILIQSWRGTASLAEGAKAGYSGILSTGFYLDHMDPPAKLYRTDPWSGPADSLTPPDKQRILGGEACVWTEFVSAENIESRIWPRTAAVAERLWSAPQVRDVPDFYRRLDAVDIELERLGLQHNASYRPMLEKLAGSRDIAALKTVADVLEPGSLGLRRRVTPNSDQNTPLDRLVDALRPESSVARKFNDLVDRWLANKDDAAAREEVRGWLRLWAANDAKVRGVRDAAPASALLSRLASQALAGQPIIGQRRRAALQPVGDLRLAVAPAILKLGTSLR